MSYFPGVSANDGHPDAVLVDELQFGQVPSDSGESPRSRFPPSTPDQPQYQQQQQPHGFPSTTADDNAMTWVTDEARGLGLYSFTNPVGMDYSHTIVPMPPSHFFAMPPYPPQHYPILQSPDGQACSFRKDSWQHTSDDSSENAWSAVAQASLTFMSEAESSTSPSPFSCSSRPSVLSSPLSRTNECVSGNVRELSPQVKVEYHSDHPTPTHTNMDERLPMQPTAVCPEQLLVIQSFPTSTSESPCDTDECVDRKPMLCPCPDEDHKPEFGDALVDDSYYAYGRRKRKFANPRNANHRCQRCGRGFQRAYNLKAHKETHNPQRPQPHRCKFANCNRKFVRPTDLKRHETCVHYKTRNFECSYCASKFSRSDTLRRHVDDGCAKRPECRRRTLKARRSSTSSMTQNLSFFPTPTFQS